MLMIVSGGDEHIPGIGSGRSVISGTGRVERRRGRRIMMGSEEGTHVFDDGGGHTIRNGILVYDASGR